MALNIGPTLSPNVVTRCAKTNIAPMLSPNVVTRCAKTNIAPMLEDQLLANTWLKVSFVYCLNIGSHVLQEKSGKQYWFNIGC